MRSCSLKPGALYLSMAVIEPVLTVIIQFVYEHPFSVHALTDALGTISLLAFNVGLIIFIIQGGFFDGMIYSFKRFSRSVRKSRLGDQDTEPPLSQYKIRDGKRTGITWPLIIISAFYFLLSLAVALFL
ncbi:DUF3899 domain-containing protein [Sporolactobacillus sp. Y61]|uniref:DUF3899 domain-containing protein n=1 Tax=Sporolactobacillus sp. Y61 TaxID=3160863 RepID=A0AAU8ICD8_9BACL|nr:DUF3899 domain-containing protein [Sporolactobacillus sp. THM19-2]RYL91473.1 DUF3899 domain-containing protein [Sporolactobacillus sp. THM19-2]